MTDLRWEHYAEQKREEMIDGEPLKFDYTSTVHHNKQAIGHDCPSRFQDNECRDCRACWNKEVKNVSYHKH